MSAHVNIFDQPEPLGRPFLGSIGLHACLVTLILLSSWLGSRTRDPWGDPNSFGGSAVGINIVRQIPMPARSGKVNPVANDTESRVPLPPAQAKQERQTAPPDPDAVALKSRNAPKSPSEVAASRQRYRPPDQDRANQLYGATGQALVSPMFGQTGSGGVGVGPSSPFGNRFGAYVDLMRQRVAEKWRTADVDPRLQTAPPVIVTFTIFRNGSVGGLRIEQTSGNSLLDFSAQRAISEASPFPPLPAGYEREDARIEFWFQLKR